MYVTYTLLLRIQASEMVGAGWTSEVEYGILLYPILLELRESDLPKLL